MNASLRIFFKIVSIIFHPLLLPTYGTVLFLWANPSVQPQQPIEKGEMLAPKFLLISVFVNTFFMPFVAIVMMKFLGFIKTFEMKDKMERIIPLIATMTFYMWAFMVVRGNFPYVPKIFKVFILGTVISVVLSFIINLGFKLSIHMVGVSGLLAAIMLMMISSEKSLFLVLIGVVILSGLVATARLYLKAHTIKELYFGFLVGLSSQMIAMIIYTQFAI